MSEDESEFETNQVVLAEQVVESIQAGAQIANKFVKILREEKVNLITCGFTAIAFDLLMTIDNKDWKECHETAQMIMKKIIDSGQIAQFLETERPDEPS